MNKKVWVSIAIALGVALLAFVIVFNVIQRQKEESESERIEAGEQIILGQEISGMSEYKADKDWFHFTLEKDGYVEISFSHELMTTSSTCWTFKLFEEDKTTNYFGEDGGYWEVEGNKTKMQTNKLGLATGKYWIYVTPTLPSEYFGSEYKIKVTYAESNNWEKEINDKATQASLMSVNQAVYGNASREGDWDWYKFEVEEDGYINIDFMHELVQSKDTKWHMELYMEDSITPYGNREYIWQIKGNENLTTKNLGVKAGIYYLKITCGRPYYWGTSDVDYNITVNHTEASNWETENNGTAENANDIELNVAKYGAGYTTGDWDWYKFIVEEDGYISLDFKHELVQSTSTHWHMELFMGDAVTYYGNSEHAWQIKGNSDLSTCSLGVKAGIYYLKITCGRPYYWGTSEVDYNVTVNYTEDSDWEKENNATAQAANEIQLNSSVRGTSYTTGDWDWYKITVEEEGIISLSFEHEILSDTSTKWMLEIYEFDAVTLYGDSSSWSIKGHLNFNSPQIGIGQGTYYIKVIGGRPYYWGSSEVDYVLTVNYYSGGNWEIEANNSAAVANELSNDSIKGTIMSEDDEDWYKINVNNGHNVEIRFVHEVLNTSSYCWRIVIYEYDATTVVDTLYVQGNEMISEFNMWLNTGDYYVVVKVGTYDIWDAGYNTSSIVYELSAS